MNTLKRSLQNVNINCYAAGHDEDYGGSLPDKLSSAINNSYVVIVILTSNGSSSSSVNQEIGYAKRADKRIIPFIESGVLVPVFLQGTEYISFTTHTLDSACQKVARFLVTKLGEHDYENIDDKDNDISTEETVVIENGDSQIYPYDLDEDEKLVGKISSDKPVNIYIVNKRNLRLFEDDYEFSYEDGIESAKKYKINFRPPRSGTWNIVIENEQSDDVEVEVFLDVK